MSIWSAKHLQSFNIALKKLQKSHQQSKLQWFLKISAHRSFNTKEIRLKKTMNFPWMKILNLKARGFICTHYGIEVLEIGGWSPVQMGACRLTIAIIVLLLNRFMKASRHGAVFIDESWYLKIIDLQVHLGWNFWVFVAMLATYDSAYQKQ